MNGPLDVREDLPQPPKWQLSDDGNYLVLYGYTGTIGQDTMSNATWTITTGDTSTFPRRGPRADDIRAVKLTHLNIREIASHILKTNGGAVQVDGDLIRTGPPSLVDGQLMTFFRVGDWLVKEYDYVDNVDVFRQATLDERKKYDLK